MIAVTHRYRFPAAHVLRCADLDAAANERLYGKCATVHGHDYGIEVTVAGPIEPRTGFVMAPDRLDTLVRERVLERLTYRLLNEDPWFRDVVPTGENLASRIHAELADALAGEREARLLRVRIVETQRNSFACGEA